MRSVPAGNRARWAWRWQRASGRFAERPVKVYGGHGHGVRTRTVLDLVGIVGTLPGALLRTLVAWQSHAYTDLRGAD